MQDYIEQLIQAGIEKSEAKQEVAILNSEIKDPEQRKKIIQERIKTRKPIQHLIGKAYFMDFEIKVTPDVLIPRPETEILVEEAVKRLQTTDNRQRTTDNGQQVILDIGTGSGVIPIALCKLLPHITVTTVDISKDAINVAKENATSNKVEERITFKEYDLFTSGAEKLFEKDGFDLIISNPPYIKEDEVQKLEPEIALHEPKLALSGSKENPSGLIYYERILELAKKNKKNHFLIALEIDPPIVEGIKQLLDQHSITNYNIIKDYSGLERCLFVCI